MFIRNRLRHCALPAAICALILCGCMSEPSDGTLPESPPAETAPISTTYTSSPTPGDGTLPQTDTAPTAETEPATATAPAKPTETTAATVPSDPPETTTEPAPAEPPETTAATEPAVSAFTVTFRDHDGQVLETQQVTAGHDASLPPNPSRSGYAFAGWEGSHRNITADTVLTAAYVSSDAPNLFTIDSSVSGDTVSVAVRLQGDILACGIECHLRYDENILQYAAMKKHNNVEANHITLNGTPQVILVWAGSQNMTADTIRDQGILLELEFRITAPSATDTVLTFLAEEMFVDVVDENGSYSSGQFTLTKGVIHLK